MIIQVFEDASAAEAAFYSAFAEVDIEVMDRVWARRVEVLCVHPGGSLLRGRPAVMQSWMEIFSGTQPPRVEYRLLGRFGRNAEAPNRVLATNVYTREEGSWRMVEHHASLPLVERSGGRRDERQLH
jgi:hypothetical protein